ERPGHGARSDAGVRRQGAGQRSLGRRQLRPHASGPGPERRRTRGAMSAAAAGTRGQLREKARQFPVGAFVAIGLLATAIGAALFLWALTTGQAHRALHAYKVNFMYWAGLALGMVVYEVSQTLANEH